MLTFPKIQVRSDRDLAYVNLGKSKVYLGRPGTAEAERKYNELCRQLQEGKSVSSKSEKKTLRPTLAQKTINPFPKGDGDSMRPVQSGVTVDALFSQYLEVQGPFINQSDRCRVRNIWQCIKEWFPGILCDDFDSVTLDEFRDRWRKKGNPKKQSDGSYRYDYVEKVKSALLKVFRWGGKKKLVKGENIYDMEQLGEASRAGGVFKKKKKRMMTDAEFESILSFCSLLWQDFFRLQYLCGMRTGEVTGLNWEEISPDPAAESDLLLFEPEKHKNAWRGEERHIGIDKEAQAILSKYRDKTGFIFNPRDMRAEELGIDPKSDDKRLALCKQPRLRTEKADRVFRAAVDKALEAGKITIRFTPYDLRKKAGTEAGLKYGVKGIQHKLGHKNINTQVAYDLGAIDMLRKMSRESDDRDKGSKGTKGKNA